MVSSVSKIFMLLACGFALTSADYCGGNCPSGTCTTCHCGTAPSPTDIASACAQFDGWSQSCCECIANAESGGNSNAQLHNTNDSDDVGLWQINSFNWDSCNSGEAPCSIEANLACAKKVCERGEATHGNSGQRVADAGAARRLLRLLRCLIKLILRLDNSDSFLKVNQAFQF
jgi:hypothetical protein